jgi:hypothetical protein
LENGLRRNYKKLIVKKRNCELVIENPDLEVWSNGRVNNAAM